MNRTVDVCALELEATLFRGVRDKVPQPWSGTFGELLGERWIVNIKRIIGR